MTSVIVLRSELSFIPIDEKTITDSEDDCALDMATVPATPNAGIRPSLSGYSLGVNVVAQPVRNATKMIAAIRLMSTPPFGASTPPVLTPNLYLSCTVAE